MARPRKEKTGAKVIGVRLEARPMAALERLAEKQFRPVANMAAFLLTAALEGQEDTEPKVKNGTDYNKPRVRATT